MDFPKQVFFLNNSSPGEASHADFAFPSNQISDCGEKEGEWFMKGERNN